MGLKISEGQSNRFNGYEPPPPNNGDDDEGGSVTFYVSVLAVFAAIGLGTYFYLGDELGGNDTSPDQSNGQQVASLALEAAVPMITSLDKKCMKGWQRGMPNYDQLHCLMTSEPKRLCKEKGRLELLERIALFDADHDAYDKVRKQQRGEVATKMIAGGGIKIGWEDAKMRAAMNNPKLSQAEKEKIQKEFFDNVDDMNSVENDIRDKVVSKVGPKGVVKATRELIRLGYMKAEDFGTPTPWFVVRAISKLKEYQDGCGGSR